MLHTFPRHFWPLPWKVGLHRVIPEPLHPCLGPLAVVEDGDPEPYLDD